MVDVELIKIGVTFIMAISMFAITVLIIYLGRKNRTPNALLMAFLPLFRGIEWLIEVFADYSENILDEEPAFITDRLEMAFGFCTAMVIIAICIEFNGLIQKPIGKISGILVILVPIFFLYILNDELIEEIEDFTLFGSSLLTSDPFRFLYGFLLPITGIILLLLTHLYYEFQVKRGKTIKDEKMRLKVTIISLIILVSAISNGYDYDIGELPFILFRGITMTFFALLPIYVILSTDYGLQNFLVIEDTGIPIFAYDFKTKKEILYEDKISLQGGFLSAMLSFSSEISERPSDFITMRSNNLYYFLNKSETHIYSLQSVIYSKDLENKTFHAIQQIKEFLAEKKDVSEFDRTQIISIVKKEFEIYL